MRADRQTNTQTDILIDVLIDGRQTDNYDYEQLRTIRQEQISISTKIR